MPEYKYVKNEAKKRDKDYFDTLGMHNTVKNNVNFWEKTLQHEQEEEKIIDGKKKISEVIPTEKKKVSDIPDQIGSFESKVAGTVLVGGDGNKSSSDLGYTVMPEKERISQGVPKRSKNDRNAPYGAHWRGKVKPFETSEIALRSDENSGDIKHIDNKNLDKDSLIWDTQKDKKILKKIDKMKDKENKNSELVKNVKKQVERNSEKKEKANQEFLKEIEDVDKGIKEGKMNVLEDSTELVKSRKRIVQLSSIPMVANEQEDKDKLKEKSKESAKEEEKTKDKKDVSEEKKLKEKGSKEKDGQVTEENTSENQEDTSFETLQMIILIESLKKQLMEKGVSEEEINEIVRRLNGLKIKDFLMVRDLIKKEYNIK